MSQTVTVSLSDRAFEALETAAQARSATPAALASAALEERFGPEPRASQDERRAAQMRFERHFGAVNLGNPDGADNESIDRDLAEEYGRGLPTR